MPVIDASVAVKWIVDEDGSDRARDLVDAQTGLLIAPGHIFLETHYAVAKLFRRGVATAAQLGRVIETVAGLTNIIPLDGELAGEASRISLSVPSRPINIHDCAYIALAGMMSDELITADQGQAGFAERLGVAVRHL